jgi:FtsH-binding integral membrane protein
LGWLATISPLVLVLLVAPRIWSMGLNNLRLVLGVYSVLMGVSLSHIFITFAAIDITRVFFITAILFFAMSFYGYTTKRDLTSVGSFLIMGLIGIIIASIVNLFLQSPATYFIISVITIFIFIGLTAYDVQKLKKIFDQAVQTNNAIERICLIGALTLYMDFINLFLALLHIFGDRKKRK